MSDAIFQDEGVRITAETASFPSGTFPVNTLNSVRVVRVEPSRVPVLVFAVGVVLGLMSVSGFVQGAMNAELGGQFTFVAICLAIVAGLLLAVGAGTFLMRDDQPRWKVVLGTARGERSVLGTRDSDLAEAIHAAIEKAMSR